MINKQEIMDFSREFGLTPNVVEKDYVLGWILDGISHQPQINTDWIFKGGTCLKKCYFETYRFSEDLDFTLKKTEHLNSDLLMNVFKEVADKVYEKSGIEIPKDKIGFEIYTNPRGKSSGQGKISYRGPMQPGGNLPSIKLDLTADEVLVLDSVSREVHHPYSDKPSQGIQAQCYCFEELFAEKIRALAERLRPRDLYDVINLYRHDNINLDLSLAMDTLDKKCQFKNISIPTIAALNAKPEYAELVSEWSNMLAHQLPALPPFEQFWQELPKVFDWLHKIVVKVVAAPISSGREAVDTSWRIPAMSQAWNANIPLEPMRFAAANRLCINLAYQGSWRLIEPYSLRKTKDGNLLLYAVKHQTGEDRSYRVDRIQNAKVTETSFAPKYAIELTAS
ncbi:nucleotidyl transferase AbiEii/AbiGii toxin family protein [bacterium]|nr:nucleotidyl transferase AbiEii/AbiGii toxin family protein [bacterium]